MVVSIVGFILLIAGLVFLIRLLIQKGRQTRHSFRESVGKGDNSIEDALAILQNAMRDKHVPKWAVEQSIRVLVKDGYDREQAMKVMYGTVLKSGWKAVELSNNFVMPPDVTRADALRLVGEKLKRADYKYFEKHHQFKSSDKKLIDDCAWMLLFGTKYETVRSAHETVRDAVERLKKGEEPFPQEGA